MNTRTLDLLANGFHLEIEGERVAQIDIPSDFVNYNFAPILGTHLLLTGDKIKNGMIVVVEDHSVRGNPDDISPENPDRDSYERRRIEEGARWALVTDHKIVRNGPDSQLVKFTAIYSDGTMRDRTYNTSFKWAVLREFRMAVVCPSCGVVHEDEYGTPKGTLDEMTRRVTTEILGQEMTFEEFSEKMKEDTFIDELADSIMSKVSKSFLGDVLEDLEDDLKDETAEESAEPDEDNNLRPGETHDEYLERMRDKAEERGEYSQDERPKLNVVPGDLNLSDPDALAALRAKLMAAPASTEMGLNGYPYPSANRQ